MGLITLSGFRSLITTAIGGRNPGTTTLNACVNGAVMDVGSAVDLPELDSSEIKITANGINFVTLADPEGTLVVKLVYSSELGTKLDYMEIADFFSHDFSESDVPLRWTEDQGKIFLHPVPDAAYSHTVFIKLKPDAFAGDGSVSDFHEMWDKAIELFATAHAFDAIGEQDRGQYWRQNAVDYCMTRLSQPDFEGRVSGLTRSQPPRVGAPQQ